ncbi:unnamed protein product [Rotaria sordida]|uniref:WWE domain-containing protein n=1 Tax=Rotaria sordida TaxID=392033 RepID=A0A818W4N0_9BILA|nr:unnamed protein product [Rotaria sordida]CAF1273123.1 unnamed protein product [Rotaria sordida]CAF3720234.1 unnamed protein product [Rotaria sordida]CAF4026928.1 unnamed protein product [Rotaria sordida]
MASYVPPTLNNSLKTVGWMWQSNPNPVSESEPATWRHYSDLENLIIEEAFQDKQPLAVLDSYYIDFESELQISNIDDYEQRPIKRVVRKREDEHLLEACFMDLPVSYGRSFGGEYGWMSPFVTEVRRDLKLEPGDVPSKKPSLIPILVEKAAQGIIEEARHKKDLNTFNTSSHEQTQSMLGARLASLNHNNLNDEVLRDLLRDVDLYNLTDADAVLLDDLLGFEGQCIRSGDINQEVRMVLLGGTGNGS